MNNSVPMHKHISYISQVLLKMVNIVESVKLVCELSYLIEEKKSHRLLLHTFLAGYI